MAWHGYCIFFGLIICTLDISIGFIRVDSSFFFFLNLLWLDDVSSRSVPYAFTYGLPLLLLVNML